MFEEGEFYIVKDKNGSYQSVGGLFYDLFFDEEDEDNNEFFSYESFEWQEPYEELDI